MQSNPAANMKAPAKHKQCGHFGAYLDRAIRVDKIDRTLQETPPASTIKLTLLLLIRKGFESYLSEQIPLTQAGLPSSQVTNNPRIK